MRFALVFLVACAGSQPDPVDGDRDGFIASKDCDDFDASVFPGANEFCDGLDNDCDGEIDEDALGIRTWRPDEDGDGYFDPALEAIVSCDRPDGYAVVGGDCDDGDPDIHPGIRDVCDGVDNDCDGAVDEDPEVFQYEDFDGDGFGVTEISLRSCPGLSGWAARDGDCDDADPEVHPDAIEICNGLDDDCDGAIDDADDPADPTEWYPDLDGDGFGADAPLVACDPGSGWTPIGGDCLDTDPLVHPEALELCGNGLDDDCDTLIDLDDTCL